MFKKIDNNSLIINNNGIYSTDLYYKKGYLDKTIINKDKPIR